MRKVPIVLKIALLLFAAIVLGGVWCWFLDVPTSFAMLREIYESAEARSIEKQREAIGLDPRQWQTPTKEIFQQETLNRLCVAIANVDSKEVDNLLSNKSDFNEANENGLTVLPGRVAPQKGDTILSVAPHTYGRFRYFEQASKHLEISK